MCRYISVVHQDIKVFLPCTSLKLVLHNAFVVLFFWFWSPETIHSWRQLLIISFHRHSNWLCWHFLMFSSVCLYTVFQVHVKNYVSSLRIFMKIQYHKLNFLAKITNCFSLSFLMLIFFPQIEESITNLDFLIFEGILLMDDCSNFSSIVLSN